MQFWPLHPTHSRDGLAGPQSRWLGGSAYRPVREGAVILRLQLMWAKCLRDKLRLREMMRPYGRHLLTPTGVDRQGAVTPVAPSGLRPATSSPHHHGEFEAKAQGRTVSPAVGRYPVRLIVTRGNHAISSSSLALGRYLSLSRRANRVEDGTGAKMNDTWLPTAGIGGKLWSFFQFDFNPLAETAE